jgi:hypothetical protein
MGVHVCFYCGADMISSDQMMAIFHLVNSWFRMLSYQPWTIKVTAYIPRLLGKCTKKEIRYEMREAIGSGPFCLLLAFEKQNPRDLKSCLDVVCQLQCTDERDRVYSILSLVRWPSGISPVPDYDKSAFDLAVETLGILFCEQQGVQAYRLFWAARLLEELFNVLPMYEFIHEAISTAPEPVGSKWDEHSRSRIATWLWYAIKIHPPSSRSDRFVQYIQTYMTSLGKRGILGLVVRALENSNLTVVGLARKLGNHRRVVEDTWIFRKENLTVHWDPEDALLFHMWIRNGTHDNGLDDVRICRFENSSYAEFDKPKAVERQDDEVWRELEDRQREQVHNVELCYTEEAFEAYPALRATTQKSR